MFYDTHRDLIMRLQGSLVMYGKHACLVEEALPDLRIRIRRLVDDRMSTVKQESKLLDVRNMRLGYVFTRGEALYLVRRPNRQWKQGIPPNEVSAVGKGRVRVSWQELRQCMEGDYLTLDQASKQFVDTNPFAQNRVKSVPFSRNWAVGQENTLHYKGKLVGEYGDKPMLHDKYAWLVESLEEVLDGDH